MKIDTRTLNGGTQHLHRFPNGYGASVVNHDFSYGHEYGLWEVAVIVFYEGTPESDHYHLTYDTPITDDVLGNLTDDDVTEVLDLIAALPNREA